MATPPASWSGDGATRLGNAASFILNWENDL
jgi:hypothetical protein